ncbi:hypothetical protein [Sutcliffiella deserti]|uniref:hypothetical protein n=1 Tax=Sutcliffiella deserti TaxID=2875501 RepID=UPI001CBB1C48|nr:hypothetical protein [Sutcliffiella deserti]
MMNTSPLKSAVIVGAGITSVSLLASKSNRKKLMNFTTKMKNKVVPLKYRNTDLPIEKGGNPHPEDLEDNKMVSEGAQYSVEYYDKKIQD